MSKSIQSVCVYVPACVSFLQQNRKVLYVVARKMSLSKIPHIHLTTYTCTHIPCITTFLLSECYSITSLPVLPLCVQSRSFLSYLEVNTKIWEPIMFKKTCTHSCCYRQRGTYQRLDEMETLSSSPSSCHLDTQHPLSTFRRDKYNFLDPTKISSSAQQWFKMLTASSYARKIQQILPFQLSFKLK